MNENENVYVLSRPVTVDGEQLEKLTLDFEKLTGEDLLAAERQLNVTSKETIMVKEISKPYLSLVVSKAAGVPVEVINALPAKDFSRLTLQAQNFLLG